MSFSPQNLRDDQQRECAKAASIMIFKFSFTNFRFYSAQEISKELLSLPSSSVSTRSFHCDLDILKIALANQDIRTALLNLYKGNISFQLSSTAADIIKEGIYQFKKGYQIRFLRFVNDDICGENDSRVNINNLTEAILNYSTAVKIISPDHFKRLESSANTSEICVENDNESIVETNVIDKKRGRPKFGPLEKAQSVTIKKLKMQVGYHKSTKSDSDDSIPSFDLDETDEEKRIRNKSLALLSLVRESDSYFQKINGKNECISIVSGLIVQNMISDGVSEEKLPIMIGQVLTLLFGKIDQANIATHTTRNGCQCTWDSKSRRRENSDIN